MKKKILLTMLVFVLLIQSTTITKNHIVNAASTKVEYLGSVTSSYFTVGKFKVNGEWAFCIDHNLASPSSGSSYSGGSIYKNESVRAILYYGFGGDGNIVGNSDDAWVATTIALYSTVHGNHDPSRSTIPGYDKLMEKAKKQDAPTTSATFSDTDLSTSVSDGVQKSQKVTFKADPRNSVKLNIPSEVTLHLNGKTYTNKTVKINGEDSFYFTAGLDYGKTVKFSDIVPSLGPYQAMLFAPSSSSQQRLSQALTLDPVALKTLAVNFEVREKKITVKHIDEYTNDVLDIKEYKREIGSDYKFSPKSSITDGKLKYIPITEKSETGTLGNENITIRFYYNLERTITVNHIDDRDGREIASYTYDKLRGDSYSYGPKTNLKKGDYIYRPLNNSVDKKTGKVGSSNITLNFYYDVPLIQTGFKLIRIHTAAADKGLPVNVNISKKNIYPSTVEDMDEAKIKVVLYQGSTEVDSNTYTAKSLPKSLDFKVPPEFLKINQKKTYKVKFEGYSENKFDISEEAASINTHGYTSSEEEVEVLESENTAKFTGVVMTEREIGKEIVPFNEIITFKAPKIEKEITGYGLKYRMSLVYKNEVGDGLKSSKFNLHVPKKIVDSYLTYPSSGDQYKIRLDETSASEGIENGVMVTRNEYELPNIKVEKRTGNLFSNEQVAEKDGRIKFDLIDGGRALYTPIWADIGNYDLQIKNVDVVPVGVHKVKVKVNRPLNLYASMYGHMDSKTGSLDAVYLRPINSDDPKYPDNWSDEDKKRFEAWNKN